MEVTNLPGAVRGVDPERSAGPEERERAPAPPHRASRYEAYIRSAAWRECPARREELALSGGRCRLCGRGAPEVRIEVHHRDYRRLGRERKADLCTLCRECHGFVTGELRRRRFAGCAMPALGDTPRMLAGRTLRDGSAAP